MKSTMNPPVNTNFSGYFHLTLNPGQQNVHETYKTLEERGITLEPDKFEPLNDTQVLIEVPDSEDELLINTALQEFYPALGAVQVEHDFESFDEFTRSQFQVTNRQWIG